MAQEVWVSHSSIGDYLKCPRSYYLKNVYRDPDSGRKIALMTPALALGQAVHQVLEGLAIIPAEQRFKVPLADLLRPAWSAITGKLGGFTDPAQEGEYVARAEAMLARVEAHPGPLARLAIRIKAPGNLPRYVLSHEEQILLCGKIDWLEYLPETDGVRILDFKTGQNEERDDSLQLPIYGLLVRALQRRATAGAQYWYLDRDDQPKEVELPDLDAAEDQVLKFARDIKWARENGYRECRKGDGCFACRDYQAIVDGEAEFVGRGAYNQDIYVLR